MPRLRRQLDEPPGEGPAAPAHTGARAADEGRSPAAVLDPGSEPDAASACAASSAASSAASAAAAAVDRLWQRLEGRGLDAKLAALEQERREAPGLVAELLALPEEGCSAAAASARFATPEVVWRLLEVSRDSVPAAAFRQLGQARKIAIHLAALRPAASLSIQLRVEVSCETAHRQIDA
ncbi:MAG TPA: hypothetical protein VN999_08305, partial [Thermoanaerobaculia bacterium]|nr:hypothetical protein [Thermoanaerobaculia bacterium]